MNKKNILLGIQNIFLKLHLSISLRLD